MTRDIAAFLAADWSMVADDFEPGAFIGIDGRRTDNPDHWRLLYPTLAAYRDEWLKQARDFAETAFSDDPETALFGATVLRDIEIAGDRALAHKKFDGFITRADGDRDILNWQTVYYCHRTEGVWRITGFTGYLPNPMGHAKA